MLTAYQLIRQKRSLPNAKLRKTLTPTHQKLSFSEQQHQSPPKKQLRRIRNRPARKQTENEQKIMHELAQPKIEVVVREKQMKRPTYRFTYTESHTRTQEGREKPEGNFRLQIESSHCRHDLLKLNRRKLEAMISKIHEGTFQPPGLPNCLAEVVLIKSQRRSALFKAEPRKNYDWKAYPDRQSSPKEFDTRDYLTCHTVKKQKKDTARQSQMHANADSNMSQMIECIPKEKKMNTAKSGSYSRLSNAKNRKPPMYITCKTEQKIGSSQSFFDRSSHSKPTKASFSAFNLKGWQSNQQRDSFFLQGEVFY